MIKLLIVPENLEMLKEGYGERPIYNEGLPLHSAFKEGCENAEDEQRS